MKKPILITLAFLLLIGLVYGSVQSISKMFIGLFDGIPDNIGNVETYIARAKDLEAHIEDMTWEEYGPVERERLRQEIVYAEHGLEILKKLKEKGQLSS